MILTAVASVALFAPLADAWEIKPTFTPKSKVRHSVVVSVHVNDEDHTAKFEQLFTYGEPASSGGIRANAEWIGITLDDQQDMGSHLWEVTLGGRGGVLKTEAEDAEAVRRMFLPVTFVYPTKAVEVGSKWSEEQNKADYSFEVLSSEKVKDIEVLKIGSKMSEKSGDMKADGTWWVAKDGRLLKYEVKVQNWVVPMSGEEPFDAIFKAELKETK